MVFGSRGVPVFMLWWPIILKSTTDTYSGRVLCIKILEGMKNVLSRAIWWSHTFTVTLCKMQHKNRKHAVSYKYWMLDS